MADEAEAEAGGGGDATVMLLPPNVGDGTPGSG
jgi:hypothetical protein